MDEFSLRKIGFNLTQIGLAYALAFIIGWDRERAEKGPGLRTFPLVAMASCGYCLIAKQVLDPETHARILYGLMTGIGFIGGGAILKGQEGVRGTATAASLWTTGAVGAAVAYQLYEIAVVLVVVNFLTLRLVSWLKVE